MLSVFVYSPFIAFQKWCTFVLGLNVSLATLFWRGEGEIKLYLSGQRGEELSSSFVLKNSIFFSSSKKVAFIC
jgi:hypothetical protein